MNGLQKGHGGHIFLFFGKTHGFWRINSNISDSKRVGSWSPTTWAKKEAKLPLYLMMQIWLIASKASFNPPANESLQPVSLGFQWNIEENTWQNTHCGTCSSSYISSQSVYTHVLLTAHLCWTTTLIWLWNSLLTGPIFRVYLCITYTGTWLKIEAHHIHKRYLQTTAISTFIVDFHGFSTKPC